MTGRSAAAKPYARALHELARERNQAEAVATELDSVVRLIEREAQIRELLARPWIPASVKRAVALELAQRLEVSALTRDFVALVARQGRAGDLRAISAAYRALVDQALGRVRARVRTAAPLSAEDRRALQQRLSRAIDGKRIMLEEAVDDTLLGGFIAEIDSVIVDASLDGQLVRLRERLARG